LVVDVETTGLSTEKDDVVQLALLPFDYGHRSGLIFDVHTNDAFEAFREPTVPISDEATLVTGITNEMVAGQVIDDDIVSRIVGGVDFIIAHNAQFDRVMVESIWPCFEKKPWGCTLSSIDWLSEGFSAGKLDYLGMQFGWFYDGHRALSDCEACLALLAQTLPMSGNRVMSTVREAAVRKDYVIRAVNAPYDLRDKLKQRGYRWRPAELPNGRVWWTTASDPETEMAWLRSEIYGREADIPVHEISALNRYSERIWQVH
jgi:DNA polymerase-3 subunit epsilon